MPHLYRDPLFSLRVTDDWNELPEDIANSTDLFKTYLDRFYYDHQYDIV